MHEAIIFFFTFSCNFKSIVISEVRHLATSGSPADGEAHISVRSRYILFLFPCVRLTPPSLCQSDLGVCRLLWSSTVLCEWTEGCVPRKPKKRTLRAGKTASCDRGGISVANYIWTVVRSPNCMYSQAMEIYLGYLDVAPGHASIILLCLEDLSKKNYYLYYVWKKKEKIDKINAYLYI